MLKTLKSIVCIAVAMCMCNNQLLAQTANKTTDNSTTTSFNKSSFIYGKNIGYDGVEVKLEADLFKPNLFSTNLPLVIVYFGGGYLYGDKSASNIRPFINAFTAANISAIAPNFRQGWYGSTESSNFCETVTPDKFKDAAYRAFQDNRALIRYCKANASALGIDSNKIYLFGISSGGFLALHNVYYEENMAGADRIQRLGSLDFQSNDYKNSTDVAGIIGLVAGFYPYNAVVKNTPLLLFNNTCDDAVDFNNGWLGDCSNTLRIYGPGVFTKLLEQYNNPYSLHVFCGYNHGFQTESTPDGGDAQAINYIAKKSIAFVKNNAQFPVSYSSSIASDSITSVPLNSCKNFETFYLCKEDSITIPDTYFSLSPNPITCLLQPKLNINYPKDEMLSILIADESGKIISQKKIEYKTSINVIYLEVNDFTAGINLLIVKNAAGKIIYKTKALRYCAF